MDIDEQIRRWLVPLSRRDTTLAEAARELAAIGLAQADVPFIVQLVENPKYDLPGFDVFHGATTLQTHDYIHRPRPRPPAEGRVVRHRLHDGQHGSRLDDRGAPLRDLLEVPLSEGLPAHRRRPARLPGRRQARLRACSPDDWHLPCPH
jgi:hypothetical protein